MELSREAHSFLSLGNSEDTSDDFLEAGRSESKLVDLTFMSKLRRCHADGTLGSTMVFVACGCALAALLAVANGADALASLLRR